MDRRHKKNSNWNNQKNGNQKNNQQNNSKNQNAENVKKTFQFNHTLYENEEARRERQKAIQEVKARDVLCSKCGQHISDITSALSDKATGAPVHFECALHEVEASEKLGENEKVAYIGQGRFGILYYENPRDQRKFVIKKIIDWEDKEKKSDWREELSGLYSQVD